MSDVMLGKILPPLVADLADDEDLKRRFLESVWEPRREVCVRVLERGVERGDLRAGLDPVLTIDLLAAPIVFRMLFAHAELGPDLSEQLVRAALQGLATDAGLRYQQHT